MSTNKSIPHDSNLGVMKSTTILSIGTFSSRVLGFIRDIILANILGTAMRADAFFVALRLPNMFREMVAEGATNSSLVPVFSEYLEKKSKKELLHFVSAIYAWALIVLSSITLVAVIFAPWVIRAMAPGFLDEPDKLSLTVNLTRIMFPYLILIGLTAYGMGILYSLRSFWIPSFGSSLSNIIVILSALIAFKFMKEPTYGLAIGVLFSGVAPLILQRPLLVHHGIIVSKPESLDDPGAKKVGKLLLPRLVGSGIYQLGVFVDTFCASLSSIVGTGGISAIYYANRILQFPIGVFGVSLASALLPTLSGFAARDSKEDFRKKILFSIKNIFLVMIPMTIALLLLAVPIVRVFFERGEFDAYSTWITSLALFFYALGLVGFGGTKIMVTAFYALQDTKTPVRIAMISLISNIFLNFILMHPLKIGGIALANSITASINFGVLFYLLNNRIEGIGRGLGVYFKKVLVASSLMAAVIYLFGLMMSGQNEILILILTGVLGGFVFIGSCYLLDVDQVRRFFTWISQRK